MLRWLSDAVSKTVTTANLLTEVAMNAHLKQAETKAMNFTAQLATDLHLSPELAEAWLGICLARYADQRRATTAIASNEPKSDGVEARDRSEDPAAVEHCH